jgi:hypothetical protein
VSEEYVWDAVAWHGDRLHARIVVQGEYVCKSFCGAEVEPARGEDRALPHCRRCERIIETRKKEAKTDD